MSKEKPKPKFWHHVAEEQGYFACTGWAVEDVQEQARELGFEVSKAWAKELLIDYDEKIVEQMVRAGWDAIIEMLEKECGRK